MNVEMMDNTPETLVVGTAKLTDWKEEPSLQDLKADLEEVQSFHKEHISNLNRWDDYYHTKG